MSIAAGAFAGAGAFKPLEMQEMQVELKTDADSSSKGWFGGVFG